MTAICTDVVIILYSLMHVFQIIQKKEKDAESFLKQSGTYMLVSI